MIRPHSREYQEYMRSEEWQRKRKERWKIDGLCCVMCGKELRYPEGGEGWESHHLHYKTLGHENPITDLCTLCTNCHKMIHSYYDRIRSWDDPRLQEGENNK